VKCTSSIPLVAISLLLLYSLTSSAGDDPKNPAEASTAFAAIPPTSTELHLVQPPTTGTVDEKTADDQPSPAITRRTPKATEELPPEPAVVTSAPLPQIFGRYRMERNLIPNLLSDQKAFWMRPSRLEPIDVYWAIPLVAGTSFLIGHDTAIENRLSDSPDFVRRSQRFSDLGTASLIGAAGAMYFWGLLKKNDHTRETGWLSGEALANALVNSSIIQAAAGRTPPLLRNGKGEFWQGGSSFPSDHSAAAWSVASVIAHEYPGLLTQFLAYGTAAGVSAARLTARKHFASDVLIGSVLGWYIGRQVYRAHHDPELGGESFHERSEREPNLRNLGSPYVPLDSWVYPVFDRLIALGLVNSGLAGMRPWTRLECMRLWNEASDAAGEDRIGFAESAQLLSTLQQEFQSELDEHEAAGNQLQFRLESVYTRMTGISGEPLNRSYDFGQTISNDFGRPFAEGVNHVTGLSGWASIGPMVVYVRGEYQHAPSMPALSQTARQLIPILDSGVPVPPGSPTSVVNHFQLLDAYFAVNLNSWQLSFGKQSLWWGPSQGGPMMFSDNALPITMLRIDRVSPFKLPSILSLFGPIRTQFILGQLSGQEFVNGASTGIIGRWGTALNPQPFIHGVKLSFKPTPNFEFGVAKTTLVGGPGMPFTLHKFLQSMFSISGKNGQYGTSADAGDRRSEVDFSYKIPGLRDWMTFYGDAFTEDEFSPLGYPRKSAFQGGIYLPRLPRIPKLDLRVEGGSTSPPDFSSCNGCFYSNGRFLSGFTNQGNIMGSWLGRAAQGEQAWSSYWLSTRNKIQFNYRHRKADSQFLAGGGTVNSIALKADIWWKSQTEISGSIQYETWNFPALAPRPQSNLTTFLQLTFWPHPRR
jgi:membrane-associated phospholipid phosphatase